MLDAFMASLRVEFPVLLTAPPRYTKALVAVILQAEPMFYRPPVGGKRCGSAYLRFGGSGGLQGPAPDSQPPAASCQEMVSHAPSGCRTHRADAARLRESGATASPPGGGAAVVQASTRGSKVIAAVSNVLPLSDQA